MGKHGPPDIPDEGIIVLFNSRMLEQMSLGWFLAHLSWKLKWAILIAGCPLSVRPSVRLTVCPSVNFYIFDFFSRTTKPISTRLLTDHPWGKGFQVCSNEGDRPSPRGDNSKRVKMYCKFLKIFFSRTSRPNSIKLDTNYPWDKGIQVCSNKGPGPLQGRDNHKNETRGPGATSLTGVILANISSRTHATLLFFTAIRSHCQ
jgi:hypothetical protein